MVDFLNSLRETWRVAGRPRKVWLAVLLLFSIAVFTSKATYSLLGLILIGLSFMRPLRAAWRHEPRILFLAGLFPLAIFCGAFSLAGLDGALKIITGWPWVLLVLPAAALFKDSAAQRFALVGAVLGFVLAIGKSVQVLAQQGAAALEFGGHIDSFWDSMRWGYLLAAVMVALYVYATASNRTRNFRVLCWLGVLVAGIFLLFDTQRAPWVGAAVGLTLVSFTSRVRFKAWAILAVSTVVLVAATPSLQQRVASIANIHGEGQLVRSTNASNDSRLRMWLVAREFYREQPWFGTGFRNLEGPLDAYLTRRGEQYRATYAIGDFSLRDNHSSYFTLWVQMGVLFTLAFAAVVGVVLMVPLWREWRWWRATPAVTASYAVVAVSAVVYVFYSSITSFESLILFLSLAYLALDSSVSRVSESRE